MLARRRTLGRSRTGLAAHAVSASPTAVIGHSHADVLLEAHLIRTERGDYAIDPQHLADAIERLVTRSQRSLSDDRTPRDPYRRTRPDAGDPNA